VCATAADDPAPSLTIAYPCVDGGTALSNVVVVNRNLNASTGDLILAFEMVFLNSAGVADRAAYRFTQRETNYSVIVTGARVGSHFVLFAYTIYGFLGGNRYLELIPRPPSC
jgi:hypothetical protein